MAAPSRCLTVTRSNLLTSMVLGNSQQNLGLWSVEDTIHKPYTSALVANLWHCYIILRLASQWSARRSATLRFTSTASGAGTDTSCTLVDAIRDTPAHEGPGDTGQISTPGRTPTALPVAVQVLLRVGLSSVLAVHHHGAADDHLAVSGLGWR